MTGLTLPWTALKFIFGNRRLWAWVVFPALINIVLFAITAITLVLNVGNVLGYLWTRPEAINLVTGLFATLWWVVFVFLAIVGVVLAYYVVLLVSGVVASPFNDRLSEETERVLTGTLAVRQGDESMLYGMMRSILMSLISLIFYLACVLPLLPLNLIPGFGSVLYAVVAAVASIFFLCVEYLDAPLDRYDFRYRDKLRIVYQNKSIAAGFGLGTSLLLWIPVINLLAMPIAVVAGTFLAIGIKDWPGARAQDHI